MDSLRQILLFSMLYFAFLSSPCAYAQGTDLLTPERLQRLVRDGKDPSGCIERSGSLESAAWRLILKKELSNLKQNGFGKIGSFNTDHLTQVVADVDIFINVCERPLLGSETRSGSLYLAKEKAVILNSVNLVRGLKGGEEIMLMHEFLGAMGYADENYELSSVLHVASHSKKIGLSASARLTIKKGISSYLDKNPIRRRNIQFQVAGGVTSVGGGGEPAPSEIKTQLIATALITGYSPEKEMRIFNAVMKQRIETVVKPGYLSSDLKVAGIKVAYIDDQYVFIVDPQKWYRLKADRHAGPFLIDFLRLILSSNDLTLNGDFLPK